MTATQELLHNTNTINIPQTTPQVGLVKNNAGGYVYELDIWNRLNRFLTIGTEGGTYYVDAQRHTLDNVKVIDECLAKDPQLALHIIHQVSTSGRAPKNDYALFALAKAASHADESVRTRALALLPQIARTGTHLFQFVAFVDTMRGWGPSLRNAINEWYAQKDGRSFAYQVTKYQQRHGWSHRDIFRKTHPVEVGVFRNALYRYVVKGKTALDDVLTYEFVPENKDCEGLVYLMAVESAKNLEMTEYGIIDLIQRHRLTREMIPTKFLKSPAVWTALLKDMPYTALVRNLVTLSRNGLLQEGSDTEKMVLEKMLNETAITRSRIHPIQVLYALKTYQGRVAEEPRSYWYRESTVSHHVNQNIVAALEDVFVIAFENVSPSGKRFMLALDVSSSMEARYGREGRGVHLTAAEIAAAMLMVTMRTEKFTYPVAFSSSVRSLPVNKNMSLSEILRITREMTFGSTDCAAAIKHALENRVAVDTFVVYTDNETWSGTGSPADWLRKYRDVMGIDAKLVVVATESTGFSIADPSDDGMLDVAGFDSATPGIITSFAKGDL